MSSGATYTFKLNHATVGKVEKNAVLGLSQMAYDINNRAKSKAPVLTGALVLSIRVDESDKQNGTFYVLAGGTAGGSDVPYARRREFENPKHPNTTHYMQNSFNEVTKNYANYFKGITK